MGISDRQIKTGFSLLVIALVFVWVVGIVINELPFLITITNLVLSSSIILYWLLRQFRKKVHYFEVRERVVLCSEVFIGLSAIYFMYTHYKDQWMFVTQSIIFGIHAIVIFLFLIFIWTFKMKRLF
jgi:hypothetical protein